MRPHTGNETWTYKAPVETRWMRTLFMIAWTGIAIAICGILGYGLVTTPSRIHDLILVWLGLLAASILGCNYLSWQLRGGEVIVLRAGGLVLRNTGTLFHRRLHLRWDEIEEITTDDDSSTPWWIKAWGIGGGKVVLSYLGRNRRFGQDLSLREAERVALEIRARIGL